MALQSALVIESEWFRFGNPLSRKTHSNHKSPISMKEPLPSSQAPELVFGLVAPIGVDLDLVAEVLSQSLKEMNYQAHHFRLTRLMREIPTGLTISETPYVQSFKD